MSETRNFPYKQLGAWLKRMRQKKQQTVAEVSGAVEIDSETLSLIEQGKTRPAEEILMLLISYFGMKEEEAVKLWELAGYEKPAETDSGTSADGQIQPLIVMPMDARIVYTDMATIQSNKYGVTINFLQSDGIGGKPLAVARTGMSREHAEKLLKVLQETLRKSAQKMLPAPEDKPDKSDAK